MKMLSSEVKTLLDKLYNLRGEDSVILAKMNKEREEAIETGERTKNEKEVLLNKIDKLTKEEETLQEEGNKLTSILSNINRDDFANVLDRLQIDFDPASINEKITNMLPETIEKVVIENKKASEELESVETEMNNAITKVEELGIRKDEALSNQAKLNEYFALALEGNINITRDAITSLLEKFDFNEDEQREAVKKDTVINLRVSKGPEEAATPVVTNLTQDQAVLQDEPVTLSISAYASDDGTLRYAWYMSTDGGYENAALVSRSREGNTTCAADTSVPGTYYYFCVVENSLGDDTKTTKSNMIEVVVQEKTVEKTIEVNLPSKSGLYEITVYVDGVLQYGPASVSITDDRSVIVEVTVRGNGTLPVDVYLDGAIYDSQLILFE